MKTALFNSAFISARKDHLQLTQPHLRLGVASIAAFLREQGEEVRIFDPEVEQDGFQGVLKRLAKFKPHFVAIPSYTEEVDDAGRIAAAVKKIDSEITTIIGGYHISALPEETLAAYRHFDIGVIGEGEMTMHDIVKHHAISEIEGIVYRNRSGGILRNKKREVMSSINHLPHPAWDLYQLDRYDKILAIDVIRSCPFTCEYCFRGTGKTVRHKSPEIIAKEIRTNIDLFGIREFSFYGGGTFPLSKEHALTVCRNIVKEKLNIRWGASARIQLLDEMIIRMMALAGCTHMGIGIETGDARLLAKSGKQTSLDDIVIKLKLLKKYRIDAFVYFIIGFPGEDRVSIENTRRFISRLRPITTLANFAILTPFPGTPIYEKALMGKEGIRLATKDWTCYGKQAGKALLHENFSQEALKRLQLKLYLSYYLFSPSKIRTMLKLNKTLGTFSLKRFIELGKRFV